ncbi:MAG TPA: hypothetical protein VM223_01795 [Planctomycetota bacterium]|nr:hypothetical protein [Planctomycetota bacterium]
MALPITRIDFANVDLFGGGWLITGTFAFPLDGLYDVQIVVHDVVTVTGDWFLSAMIDRLIDGETYFPAFEPSPQTIHAGLATCKGFPLNSILALAGDHLYLAIQSPNHEDTSVSGHVLIAQRTLALPAVAPDGVGGLPTLDVALRVPAKLEAIGNQVLGAKAGPNFNVLFQNAAADSAKKLSDLPTADANNRIAGIQGTVTTLDALKAASDWQVIPGANYDGSTLRVAAALCHHGRVVGGASLSACTFQVYTAAGVAQGAVITGTKDATGYHFYGSQATEALQANQMYVLHVAFTYAGVSYPFRVPMPLNA